MDPIVNEYYTKNIINSVDAENIRNRRFKVVADTGCGAGSLTLPFYYVTWAARCSLLELSLTELSLGETQKPTPENLTELLKLVKITGADMGVAHDGDADRIVFIDENGVFINDEVLLAMMAKYMLEHESGPLVTLLALHSVCQISQMRQELNSTGLRLAPSMSLER